MTSNEAKARESFLTKEWIDARIIELGKRCMVPDISIDEEISLLKFAAKALTAFEEMREALEFVERCRSKQDESEHQLRMKVLLINTHAFNALASTDAILAGGGE